MSNLDNLTSKIIDDANKRAETIIKEAKQEQDKIIGKQIEKANNEKINIIERAKLTARSKADRVISNAHLTVRNKNLEAKQEVMDKVFTEALLKLESLTKEQYLEFVKNSIMNMKIDGDEEIIVPSNEERINEDFINSLNKELKSLGRRGELKLSSEKRDIKTGFIIYKNGIEINNSFEALVSSLRDELEQDIIGALFG
ncbi:V-type ATP synthase subunit E [Clostridium niameyense]|uniref:V-type proton ATPase subunit E n=1 Tax=Clostridium niameyense TaxID=1622073 RepID=A0A6M0R6X6_9CLOT|nr:V-type ATP synthase subunit E family protein [Clostridium niameyense]NEZ45924.1 V-type ATP synthase subunit E [Clostridium niameyense]